MVSPLEVISLGSSFNSHQVRFVKSGHLFAESDIIKSRSAVLKAFSKSRSRMASPLVCCLLCERPHGVDAYFVPTFEYSQLGWGGYPRDFGSEFVAIGFR